MQDKWNDGNSAAPEIHPDDRRDSIRADLERRGVAREFSKPVAERLLAMAPNFTPEEYSAVLDGVAAAYTVHRDEREMPEPSPEVAEIERLMKGFATELAKLQEGLKVLTAYSTRMRNRSAARRGATLH